MRRESNTVTFIRAWRKHRGLTIEQLAPLICCSEASLSRIERGKQPYNQTLLEDIAAVLNCQPADLLTRHPDDPEGLWSVWENIRPDQRPQAIEILKTLARTTRETLAVHEKATETG